MSEGCFTVRVVGAESYLGSYMIILKLIRTYLRVTAWSFSVLRRWLGAKGFSRVWFFLASAGQRQELQIRDLEYIERYLRSVIRAL